MYIPVGGLLRDVAPGSAQIPEQGEGVHAARSQEEGYHVSRIVSTTIDV